MKRIWYDDPFKKQMCVSLNARVIQN